MSPLNPSTRSTRDLSAAIPLPSHPSGEATSRCINRRASKRQRRRARQGVVLLLVVTLLVMFLLIAVTGVIVSAAYHSGSKAAARMTRAEVRHEDFTDRVLMQLIRGTDPRSALWGHDLLADFYGNDGLFGTVQGAASPPPEVPNPPNNPVGPRPNPAADPNTGNQFIVFHALLIVNKSVAYPAPDHFVGRVLTFVDGPWAGKSTRITKSGIFEPDRLVDGTINNPASTLPSQIVYTFAIDNINGSFNLSNTAAIVGTRFLINGVPFNGTGAGYKTAFSMDEFGNLRDGMHTFPDDPSTLFTLDQTHAFAHDNDPMTPASQIHTCLLPNYRSYPAGALPPYIGGADEPYDSVSLQDMWLSWTPSNPRLSPIIPSFYRYQLVRYLRDVIFTNDQTLDGGAINDAAGTPFIQTTYENLSPEQRLAFWNVMNRAIMRPLPIPDQVQYPVDLSIAPREVPSHKAFTGGNPGFNFLPTETVYDYLSRLAGLGGSLPLDADTDGDQIADSIWIDPGLPVQTSRDGRRYKILAAIQVRDLNAALNVNTMSSGPVQGNLLQQVDLTNLAATMPIGRGAGHGPAEIAPPNAPGISTDPTLHAEVNQLLIGLNNIPGRYGDVPGAGEPSAPFAFRGPTDAANLIPKLKAPAPYTSTDLLGLGQIGFDHDGQPVFVNQTLSLFAYPHPFSFARPELSPYAFDPLRRNQKFDLPFTEAELEKMYRKYDVDGSINPGRVEFLASNSAFGPINSLRLLTSISTHISLPGNLPPAEARRLGASVNSTYYAQYFLPIYTARLNAQAPDPTTDSQAQLQAKVRNAQAAANMVMPFELQHGYPMNVNRPFGNGNDENGNGVIDEILLVGGVPVAEDLGGRAFVDTNRPVDGVGNNSIRDDFPQYGSAVSTFTNGEYSFGNGGVIDPRVLYARHLYCSAAFVMARSGGISFQYQTTGSNAQALTLRRIAQWAINCAEFRDPDGIMTAFEYDINPFDGWDVNGDPKTYVDAMGNTVAGTEPTAGLVWGCEQPELLMTESMALHNRGAEDTADDGSARPIDNDLDQVRFPQGSVYLEFFCPRPRQAVNPVNLVQYGQFPMELYNVGPNGPELHLARMAPQQPGVPGSIRPVWRVFITKNLRNQSMNRQTQPNANIEDAMMNPIFTPRDMFGDINNAQRDDATFQPDLYFPNDSAVPQPTLDDSDFREIWFTDTNPTAIGISATDAQHIFYNRASTSFTIEPGHYLVVGPRMTTPLGDASPQILQFQNRAGFPTMNPGDDLEVFVTDTAGNKSGASLAPVATNGMTGNVQPMSYMVCASNLPTAWDPMSGNSSLVVVPGMTPIKGVGINISLSLVESNPTYWATANEPNVANERFSVPLDTPFDEDPNSQLALDGIMVSGQKSTGTWEDVRTAFLQRLANPLLPWNPMPGKTGHNVNLPLNPYLTVDWMPLDLTVFNGEDTAPASWDSAMNGEWDSYDSQDAGVQGPPVKLQTRERGSNNSPFPWTYETSMPTMASTPLMSGQNFDYNLVHTLGFLNEAMGGATRKANSSMHPAIFNGSPFQPFPWLTWYNRPYSSPGEVLLVPATSAGRLFHEYGDIATVAANNESTNGPYQPSNPNSVRAASSDYVNGGGTLTFPNGNYLPFPHLLNFFQTSMGLDPSTGTYTTQHAPDFSRLIDLLGMPGPFMGSEQWYSPDRFSEANVATTMVNGYRAPFNYLPNFREAGRLNLNTLGDYNSTVFPQSPVWNALTANLPHDNSNLTGSPDFHTFNQARMGTGITNSPELVNNPFRPANAADLMPDFSLPITGVASSQTWGGAPLSQLGTSEVGLLRRDATDLNRPLFHLPTDVSVPANPSTRLHAMNRLFNLTTNQANSLAVWITLGKFEVEYNGAFVGSSQIPDGYALGAELGFEDGTQQRHRSFFIIDRTKPVAYETGKNHNAAECILLRRVLE
jgi:hypothetical protein